ncbi:MAG: ice-binding family protein [Bradymonadaceae bacterium]
MFGFFAVACSGCDEESNSNRDNTRTETDVGDGFDSGGELDTGESDTGESDTGELDSGDESDTDAESDAGDDGLTVLSTAPADGDTDVFPGENISVTFSEEMDVDSLTITTFTLTAYEGTIEVVGVVTYADSTAVFTPDADLNADTVYTATITTGARSDAGVSFLEDYVWSFTTSEEPTVLSTTPGSDDTDVFLNESVSAFFSEKMDRDTLTTTTFTVTSGQPAVEVIGNVVYYPGSRAVFWPAAALELDTLYTATITTGAESFAGLPLAADYSWTFTTGDEVIMGNPVDLGTAGDFAILAKSGISTVPASAITGDIGVSPVAATYITGFSLIADASNTFSTSTQVTGEVFAADYTPPTPSKMTTAVSDMEIAFTDAASRAPGPVNLGAGDVSGMTLDADVYKWGTGLLITGDVTLTGNATDVWIFQIAQDLTITSGAKIILAGGIKPENIFWQVSGTVELGTTVHLEGIVLSQTAIVLKTGATVNGRLLAQTAVELDENVIVEPN